jgi:energy-coupling factor transport system permease protein
MSYRRRASPLHAARASCGAAYCVALAALAIAFDHPLVLACVGLATLGAAAGARVLGDVARLARLGVAFAILVGAVNVLVSHRGLTVVARLGELPVVGRVDVTAESLAYGGLLGLRVVVVTVCFAVFAAAIDPDELLRLFRRVSFRSGLTAALALRMVPVLARDARRIAQAQRCRPRGPHSGRATRVALLRAVTSGALDRAVDLAATLEVRGYGARAARPAGVRAPWSRHDLAFAAAALALVVLGAGAKLAGVARFEASPRLVAPLGPRELALLAALLAVSLLPFADRRGIER